MNLYIINGAGIKYLRTLNKLSSKDLASRLGVTPSYLSRIEHDKEHVSDEMANKMGKIFNCTIVYSTIEPGRFFCPLHQRSRRTNE